MIRYFFEDTSFKFSGRRNNSTWLKNAVTEEGKKLGDVNIIFCSDPYLLEINKQYLGHDYYTDVITFDYCENDIVSGDVFISVDTVRDNAAFYKAEFKDELSRVMVHGVLHLLGYDDHTEPDQKTMRSKEDYYLAKRVGE